jgi:hypothetical protein
MGIGSVLRPAVLVAFMDCAGLQQQAHRPTLNRPEIRQLSLQHFSTSLDGESGDPAVGSEQIQNNAARHDRARAPQGCVRTPG